MELPLSGLQWTTCLIYPDGINVYGTTFDECLQRLRMVQQWFWQAGLKLKPSKCHIFESQMIFLGHVLTSDVALPDLDNVEKIKPWPVPTCVSDVWAILGMENYCCWFIKDYSKKMQPPYPVDKDGHELWVDHIMPEVILPPERSINWPWHNGIPKWWWRV